jgi:hypothetical protein
MGARPVRPSHVYPTTSGRRRLLVASSCLGCRQVRDAEASLSCTFRWWQVMGSNHRRLSRGFTESRQALPRMLFTCRDVVIGVTGQPLNHSSTTSVGNQLAAAGHDRSGGPGAGRRRQPAGRCRLEGDRGHRLCSRAKLKPVWRCRSASHGRSQCLASSSVSFGADRLCWTAARHTDPVEVQ